MWQIIKGLALFGGVIVALAIFGVIILVVANAIWGEKFDKWLKGMFR